MPTPIGHSLAGLAVHLAGRRPDAPPWRSLLLLVFLANLPDIDLLPGYLIGVPRAYHWGPTHSLFAALAAGTIVALIARAHGRRATPAFAVASAAYTSHIILDLLLGPGARSIGLQVLWPFSTDRFMAPVGLFRMLPGNIDEIGPVGALFTPGIFPLILRELAILTPVCLVAVVVGRRLGTGSGRRRSRQPPDTAAAAGDVST